ncbi:MAG: hypothetical protein IJS47_02025 [Clostridia bacterium]|nr:hypothetical protein [Clostridia bacterium]
MKNFELREQTKVTTNHAIRQTTIPVGDARRIFTQNGPYGEPYFLKEGDIKASDRMLTVILDFHPGMSSHDPTTYRALEEMASFCKAVAAFPYCNYLEDASAINVYLVPLDGKVNTDFVEKVKKVRRKHGR